MKNVQEVIQFLTQLSLVKSPFADNQHNYGAFVVHDLYHIYVVVTDIIM